MSTSRRPRGFFAGFRRKRDERGAYAILFSMALVLLMALAAISVDIASQVSAKQRLKDTMDAAAHAGAFALSDDPLNAVNIARAMALENDPDASVAATLYCVIGSTGVDKRPMLSHIPGTCNPGGSNPYPGIKCNEVICAIPCTPSASNPLIKCNTMQVADQKDVDFAFAPAIGYDKGSTGAVVSTACTGSCGTDAPNPMDVVVMADRTASMVAADRARMVTGIKEMLTTMEPSMHYVAFGALHKSVTSGATCKTSPIRKASSDVTGGTWVPVPFSDDYLTEAGVLDDNSALVKAITCLPESPSGEFGTHIAGALKGASRYLLGKQSNNLSSLPERPGGVKKAIIFETDGMPDEVFTSHSTALSLGNADDIGAGYQGTKNTNGQKGCDNFKTVAASTKAEGALIVTIGFGDATKAFCRKNGWSSSYPSDRVRDVLAAAASPHPVTGNPSVALGSCDSDAAREAENNNGDFYFCAAKGDELGPIFKTALTSLAGGIRLLKLPR